MGGLQKRQGLRLQRVEYLDARVRASSEEKVALEGAPLDGVHRPVVRLVLSLHWRPEPGPLALGRSGGELLDGGFIVVKQAPEDPACVSAHEEGHTLFAQTLVLEGKTRASMAYELVRLGLRAHELIAENGDPRATARPVPNKKLSVCTQ